MTATPDPKTILLEAHDAYAAELLRFAYTKTGDQAVAEDLVAETFLKYWKRLKEGIDIKADRAFLFHLLRCDIIDHYRVHHRRIHVPIESIIDTLSDGTSLADDLDTKMDITRVMEALQKLKPAQADLLLLRYTQDLSFSEIAQIVGDTENSLRVQTHRALATLRKYFTHE